MPLLDWPLCTADVADAGPLPRSLVAQSLIGLLVVNALSALVDPMLSIDADRKQSALWAPAQTVNMRVAGALSTLPDECRRGQGPPGSNTQTASCSGILEHRQIFFGNITHESPVQILTAAVPQGCCVDEC